MAIIDAFIFSDELDLLEIRLNELNDVVDRFVIVEGNTTFSGRPKPLHFAQNAERFSAFSSKIQHLVVEDFPAQVTSRWDREHWQRNAIVRALRSLDRDDVVMIGDADEIPSPDAVRALARLDRRVTLRLGLSYYFLNCRSRLPWYGTVAAPLRLIDSPERMRQARETYPLLNDGAEAGWHFSYLGGAQAVRNKIETFSHDEYDTDDIKSLDRLTQRIEAAEDLFDRPAYSRSFYTVPLDERMPAYVRSHAESLSRLIRGGPAVSDVDRPDDRFCPDQLALDVTFVLGAEASGTAEVMTALESHGLRIRPATEATAPDVVHEAPATSLRVTGEREVAMHATYGRYPAGRIGLCDPTLVFTVQQWAMHVRAARLVGVFRSPPAGDAAIESWCRDNECLLRLRKHVVFPIIDADLPEEIARKTASIASDLDLNASEDAPLHARVTPETQAAPGRAAAILRALQTFAAIDAHAGVVSKDVLREAARGR